MNGTIADHFDDEDDKPMELEANTKSLMTLLSRDTEDQAWLSLSAKTLRTAYDKDEEEYSLDLIKESLLSMDQGDK